MTAAFFMEFVYGAQGIHLQRCETQCGPASKGRWGERCMARYCADVSDSLAGCATQSLDTVARKTFLFRAKPMTVKPLILPMQPLTDDQQACVDLLTEALAEAKRGKFSTIAIVCCMENGFASVMAGTQAGALNLACDDLKATILKRVLKS